MWHLSNYQPKEVIDLAVEIEKKGGDLYKKLAQKTTDEQIKKLLLFLADEEEKHQVQFTAMGKFLAPVNASETYPGEYFEYLKLTVETHMFNDGARIERLVEEAKTELDIIRLATNFEKDTIVFFNGLRSMVTKDNQATIEDLIMEEQIHLVKLARLRKEVLAKVANKWKCGACGYLLEADLPPDLCPSCNKKCEFIDNNCYTPDCGSTE